MSDIESKSQQQKNSDSYGYLGGIGTAICKKLIAMITLLSPQLVRRTQSVSKWCVDHSFDSG